MIYQFRDCELDTARFELRRDGVVQPVEPQVYRVLLYLLEHRDRVVTRDELFRTIWEGRVVADSALYSRIKSARAAIGDQGAQPAAIRTVSRTGYQFVAPVHTVPVPQAQVEPLRTVDTAQAGAALATIAPRTRRQSWWFAVAVAALGAVGWGYSVPLHREAATHARDSAGPASGTVTAASIAVLPFGDLSPAQDQGHFVGGLVEELAEQLARMPGLRIVKGRSAIGSQGAGALARALGVEYLLEGSVRNAGAQLRISAQLVDATGRQIWSRTYERARGDALTIQREVATSVAATFIATPDPAALDTSGGGTSSTEAYEAYLAARAALVDPDIASPDDYRQARLQLRHAVALDPQFAVAHAWLALSYLGTDTLPEDNSAELHELASLASARALELTPDMPWALVARARLLMRERRWAEAEQIFLRLQHTSPVVESRWNCLGCFYMMVGHIDEAVKRFEHAELLDPQLATNVLCGGFARAFSGDPESFMQTYQHAASLHGDERSRLRQRFILAFAAGRSELEASVAAIAPARGSLHQRMIENLDDPRTALAELRKPGQFPAPQPAWYAPMALWAAHFGDPHLALHFLERSAEDPSTSFMVWHPVFAEARRLPGFDAVLEKLGLVDYWRESKHWPQHCRPAGKLDVKCS